MLSSRIKNISFSGTMEIAAKTIELKSKGINVIDLCVGEPDLPTPNYIKQAGLEAIDSNKTKYTLNPGIKELRNAISQKYLKEYGAKYSIDEIIVSTGAKQAIYNALQAILNYNDEVLIPIPYYVSYPHMVNLAGGIPVFINTKKENNFNLTSNELHENINRRTKAIILCNPSNPTGAVYTESELRNILKIAVQHNLVVLCDEIYEKLIYSSAKFTSIASFGEEFKNNVIIINGVSKTYAMTGWRIGYALAPKIIITGMSKLQSHSTSNACTISQYASLAALTGSQVSVEEQRLIFEERRNYIEFVLHDIYEISFIKPSGAFYFFINIEKIITSSNSISDSREFCLKLLDEYKVAAVPGIEFGLEGYIRISYAKSMEELIEAMKRFKEFLKDLN
jgi:aspartate aminotransferase